MTKPSSFNLITSKTAEDLSAQVNNHLADGWRLYGKPFFGDGNLYQAVILKEERDKRLRRTTEDG
jgi:hypothetical protein